MIRWHLTPATQADLGTVSHFLSAAERERAAAFAVEKRRRDWLLGRLAAKHVVRHLWAERFALPLPPSFVEIANEPSGAPFARLSLEAQGVPGLCPGERIPVRLTISHSNGWALSAAGWGGEGGKGLGADLEIVEPRSPEFVADYLAPEEQAVVARCRHPELSVSAFWSAKEAVLKALGVGLAADTRDVVLRSGRGAPSQPRGLEGVASRPLSPEAVAAWDQATCAWRPFSAELRRELAGRPENVTGCWRRWGDFVMAIARLDEPKTSEAFHAGNGLLHPEAA